MAPIKRNPLKLVSLTRTTINRTLKHRKYIRKLELPKTLQEELSKEYLQDRISCASDLPMEVNEIEYEFEQPWITLDPDEFLYIMNDKFYKDGVPWFAFAKNAWFTVYYQFGDDCKRYCYGCALDKLLLGYQGTITKWKGYDIIYGEDVIDQMQCTTSWCEVCYLSTLFWIEEFKKYHHSNHSQVWSYEPTIIE